LDSGDDLPRPRIALLRCVAGALEANENLVENYFIHHARAGSGGQQLGK